jgi:hypothetical protein
MLDRTASIIVRGQMKMAIDIKEGTLRQLRIG